MIAAAIVMTQNNMAPMAMPAFAPLLSPVLAGIAVAEGDAELVLVELSRVSVGDPEGAVELVMDGMTLVFVLFWILKPRLVNMRLTQPTGQVELLWPVGSPSNKANVFVMLNSCVVMPSLAPIVQS